MKAIQQISLPTTILLVVFIAAWVVMAALHLAIPAWMVACGAIVGKVFVALVQSATGSDNGNSTGSPPAPGG